MRAPVATVALLALLLLAGCGGGGDGAERAGRLPPIRHVFVIVLENKDYGETFGPSPGSPYLASTLRAKGALLSRYYAIAHRSLPNYLTLVSGQPPNRETQANCLRFSPMRVERIDADGIAAGQGCVYPPQVKTVADQLEAKGLRWKGYMQGIGAPCRHPALGAPDDAQVATRDDMYATRHNPFVYFRSIIDDPARCRSNVVPVEELARDLRRPETTPNFAVISPDLCDDGHDVPCVDGRPGGLSAVDGFLREWVPVITRAPAFRKSGMLVVTFDEAESDGSSCCAEPQGPNVDRAGGEQGDGGGRVGAVVVSPFVAPGSLDATAYNHYSLLRTVEDLFGLAPLGYARRAERFGGVIFSK